MLKKKEIIQTTNTQSKSRTIKLRNPKTEKESKQMVFKNPTVKLEKLFNADKPILIFDKDINYNHPKTSTKNYLNQKAETSKIPSNRVFTRLKLKIRPITEGANLPLISIKKSTYLDKKGQIKLEKRAFNDNDKKPKLKVISEVPEKNDYFKKPKLRITEQNVSSLHKYFKEYSYKEDPNLNCRKSMEDFSDINTDFYHDNKYDIAFFGLYDGFCGKEVAVYLKQHLQQKLMKILCKLHFNIELSLAETFNQIEKEIQLIQNSTTCGSTATVVLLINNYLYTANVGNSTCYGFTQDKAKKISVDHDCKNPNEIQRIKQSGGEVFNERVFGCLSLTRCFGALEFKPYGVTSKPTISKQKINHNLFTVIASDGVWDVLTSSNLLEMVNSKELNANELSDLIIKTSLNNYTKDNISCIVIKY